MDHLRLVGAGLLGSLLPLAIGIGLFLQRVPAGRTVPVGSRLHLIERSAILGAGLLMLAGLIPVAIRLRDMRGAAFATASAAGLLAAGLLLLILEVQSMRGQLVPNGLVAGYVLLALVGQLLLGVALLRAGWLPVAVGWFVVLWNGSWLVVLPMTTPGDMYFPILHHLAPALLGAFLIGNTLARGG